MAALNRAALRLFLNGGNPRRFGQYQDSSKASRWAFTEAYQWDLAKLSPKEYYEYLKTGEYPLKGR